CLPIFFITLAVYLVATAATAFSWDLASFMLFRFLTGAGIGGEYTAINSTIQELVPARYRGWTDLVINGSFWVGAAIGAGASIVLLDPALFSPDIGWRVAFFMGSVLGLVIFIMRFWIPESPRWLVIHGRPAEAQLIIAGIEERFRRRGVRLGEEHRSGPGQSQHPQQGFTLRSLSGRRSQAPGRALRMALHSKTRQLARSASRRLPPSPAKKAPFHGHFTQSFRPKTRCLMSPVSRELCLMRHPPA